MEFALSEEQRMLQQSIDRFLQDNCGLEQVRRQVKNGAAHDAQLWQGLAGLGVSGLLVPESCGGMSMSMLDAMLVQEMLGRHVSPVAFLATSVLAVLAISRTGSEEQQQRWLPRIADGSLQVAVAISEHSGARGDAGVECVQGRLSGRVLFALGAPEAELVLVAGGAGDLYAVDTAGEGVQRVALRSIDDTQALAEFVFTGAAAEPLAADMQLLNSLQDAGRVMLAADTLGAAQKMLEMAVSYAGERKQFNRVIGSFQAVKHMCAEMAAELEPCRSLVWYAAYACDAVPEESRLMACHAKAHLAEVGRFVARTATEVHGGMGFTDLLGLHYWFKRIGCNRQLLGSPERARDDAARLQGWVAA